MRLVAPEVFERCDVPTPSETTLHPGEVLLRTMAGGVCGSDLTHFRGTAPLDDPTAQALPGAAGFPAHEVVGEVLASRHTDVPVGSTVVGWATATDGIAEYVVTRGDSVAPYQSDLPPHVAVMLQPLACVLSAVDRLGPLAGCSVAVLGQGPIGVLFSHVIKQAGASRVTGVDRVDRSDVAETFGVDTPVWSTSDRWVRAIRAEDRPDVVVEAVGHQIATLGHAIEAVAPGGRIYYFGIPDDAVYPLRMELFLRKDLTLLSGVTRDRRRWLTAADDYVRRHPDIADGYVTGVVPAATVGVAYECAARPRRGQLKLAFTA